MSGNYNSIAVRSSNLSFFSETCYFAKCFIETKQCCLCAEWHGNRSDIRLNVMYTRNSQIIHLWVESKRRGTDQHLSFCYLSQPHDAEVFRGVRGLTLPTLVHCMCEQRRHRRVCAFAPLLQENAMSTETP